MSEISLFRNYWMGPRDCSDDSDCSAQDSWKYNHEYRLRWKDGPLNGKCEFIGLDSEPDNAEGAAQTL